MMQDARKAEELPRCLLRGLDSLYVSFYLDLASSRIDFAELEFQKQELRGEYGRKFVELDLGSERFALRPFGKSKYRYVLSNRLFEVRLAEHMQPSCHVQFFSESLWQLGLQSLIARFEQWRASLGIVMLQPEVIARADWAFDFDLGAPDFDAEHFISRATKDAIYREHQTAQTYSFGRGDTVVRVYDKSAEIEQESGKAWFHELWGQKDGVWRVEFQIRGERLKAGGIRTLDDLQSLQNDLLRELANGHTTLRRPNGDSNRSRWPLHPLWQQLLDEIASLPQTGLVRDLDPQRALHWRREKQLKALYGSLKGLGAVQQLLSGKDEPPTLNELLERLSRLLERQHCPTIWRDDIEQRVNGYRLGQW